MDIKSVVPRHATEGRRRWLIGGCVALVVVLALTVSVVSLAAASGSTFPDVPVTDPYYAAITDLAYRGVIGGFDNGNFGPADPVTRQQFAKMIVLAGGYPVSESDVCPFVDVVISGPSGFYPDNYVAVCAAHGITTGKTATTFDPYSNITRYQAVSMVVRAADNLHPGLLTAPPSGWTGTTSWQTDPIHGPNAARAEYNGLLAGLSLSALDPRGYVTRGEVAQVLYNLMQTLTPPTTTTSSTTSTTLVTTTTSSTTTTSTTVTVADYENLGGSITAGPAAASWAAGRLDVFARGTAGSLMHLGYDGQWALTWQDLGGNLAADSSPAAVASAAHPLDVVIRGTDDALWYKYYSGSFWSAWDRVGGTLASSPTAASRGAGSIDVFVRGSNGALLQTTYDSGAWTGTWTNLGGTIKAGSDPAAVAWGADRIDVFARGTDDALWHVTWNGADWSAWEELGGTLSSSPAVTSTVDGRLDVFARGRGGTIWHRAYSQQTGWAAWEDLGGGAVASAPAAVSWGIDRIDLFVLGGNALWHKWWNGSAWLH